MRNILSPEVVFPIKNLLKIIQNYKQYNWKELDYKIIFHNTRSYKELQKIKDDVMLIWIDFKTLFCFEISYNGV